MSLHLHHASGSLAGMEKQHFDFDLIVIGGGSAGYAAARTAYAAGLEVAVIDGAAEIGGLCILRGCMPSKTLIESANRRLAARHAADFDPAAARSRCGHAAGAGAEAYTHRGLRGLSSGAARGWPLRALSRHSDLFG
ncbi:MAG: FAD-dependent oxidoreductase [Verrucomicrobiaceae bacterium]|nr:FAD-dependent oxidoreductase [Verrucomicrobiaceae bacterium]